MIGPRIRLSSSNVGKLRATTDLTVAGIGVYSAGISNSREEDKRE
jgi:hypothetical protein